MKNFKDYLQLISVYNLSIFLSYYLTYFRDGSFQKNFSELNITEFQFILLLNLLVLLVFFTLKFLIKFDSMIVYYLVTYFFSTSLLILFFWTIKFVNLSRTFTLLNFFIYIIISIFTTRFIDSQNENIYISFEKELCDKNINFHFTDYSKFPADFLDLISKLLKEGSLQGLVFSKDKIANFSFIEIIEISNYFGVNVYELKNDRYKLIHRSTSLNKIIKNLEDAFLLIFFLPISILLIVFFGLILLIFDGRPIFYKQPRVGLNGRYFDIFKFRTMNNLDLSAEELEKLNEKNKIVFKAKNDPRITRLGSFYRKSSIDELPQIINVFKNEMSFVGPRPPIISEVKQYELKHLKRISVKPGITGLWQVSLRQDNNFDRWVKKDIEYIENWSILLDFKIILKTFNEIFNLTGD